ncbi:filamentous hemagglutinin N-terminal domain-containing protein [Synechococcus sp. BO 8801]|uniref:filamentous hemagglutinin N-terminal domain-containing protein n=1 Tax=Synechococcus sp. BO 8801 TaxID=169670 RepID=UPI001E3C7D7B|nr:filamentous hemagglutinin N-terminal domain-containing protein [Synechococcus sp. BO 8801]
MQALLWRLAHTGMVALTLAQSSAPPMARAQVLPTSPQQVGGGAHTVTTSGSTLTVTTPGRAVISWGSFNIGPGATVDFQNQGAVLNYVRSGGGASRLDGVLRAINPVVLINNQGITVGSTALISVPSILLSTGTLAAGAEQRFLAGEAYGPGLNAPLISIVMADGDGPIQVDGTIRSTNGGGIALVAPSVTVGPTATILTRGTRSAATGTDGVNTTVNGVQPEGSLWIGTTGLPTNTFTAAPGLPTGFGFIQISGKPSPQRATLSLQATYDLERFVISTSGAKAGQFNDLFFSPNFRAADFYVYDGIEAIEEGHRESTNGGSLKRRLTHTDAQGNLVSEERDEASVLGLTLPAGAVLLNAEGVRVDQTSGKLTAGTLTVQPGSTALTNPDFVDQFGTGPLKVTIDGGASSVVGSNGVKAPYNPQTGVITWDKTIPGTPTTQMVLVPGGSFAINQGQTNPGFSRPQEAGTSQRFVSQDGYYYHGHNGQYAGTSPCSGCRYVNPTTGEVTYWKGHFTTDSNGRPQFTTSGNLPPTHVLYMVGGRTYVTDASSFNPQTTPKNPPTQVVRPPIYQQVTTPGTPTVVQLQQALPLAGQASIPQGSGTSTWQRPTPPMPQPTAAPNPQTAVPILAPMLVPQQTQQIPTVGPTPAPTQMPVPQPTIAPQPTAAPNPQTAVPILAPTLVPQQTQLTPTAGPTPAPTRMPVPQPTTAPQPVLTPTMAPAQVPPKPTTAPQPLLTPTMAPSKLPPQPTTAPQPVLSPTMAPPKLPPQPTTAPQPLLTPTMAPAQVPPKPTTAPQPLLTPTMAPGKLPPQPTTAPQPVLSPTMGPPKLPPQPTTAPQPLLTPTMAPAQVPPKPTTAPQPVLTPTMAPGKLPPQPTAAPQPVLSPTMAPPKLPPQPTTAPQPLLTPTMAPAQVPPKPTTAPQPVLTPTNHRATAPAHADHGPGAGAAQAHHRSAACPHANNGAREAAAAAHNRAAACPHANHGAWEAAASAHDRTTAPAHADHGPGAGAAQAHHRSAACPHANHGAEQAAASAHDRATASPLANDGADAVAAQAHCRSAACPDANDGASEATDPAHHRTTAPAHAVHGARETAAPAHDRTAACPHADHGTWGSVSTAGTGAPALQCCTAGAPTHQPRRVAADLWGAARSSRRFLQLPDP